MTLNFLNNNNFVKNFRRVIILLCLGVVGTSLCLNLNNMALGTIINIVTINCMCVYMLYIAMKDLDSEDVKRLFWCDRLEKFLISE